MLRNECCAEKLLAGAIMLSRMERQMEKRRILCVDLLRGLDIFILLVVCYGVMAGAFQVWPLRSPAAIAFWQHSLDAFAGGTGHVPTGFGLLDFAQPLFVFVTGVSASLAAGKFFRAEGFEAKAFWKRLATRTLMLWVLGSLIRGLLNFRIFNGNPPSFCFYSDTLHTIALAYFASSVGLLLRSPVRRLAVGLVLIGAAAVVMATCGDYTQHGNAARLIEEAVYSRLGGRAKDFCYLLTTLTWAGMGILASLAGDVLKRVSAPWAKVRTLALGGLAAFVVGWALSFRIPPIRYIYTVSFVFETLGLSSLLLAGLYALTDIWNVRRGTGIFLLFGRCSLAAWMIANFFNDALSAAAAPFVAGLPRLFGTVAYQPLFIAIVRALLLIWAVWAWRKFKENGK